jgi:DHA1 family bicyclomycin/chloramphenicol resistance-like MFS transporter
VLYSNIESFKSFTSRVLQVIIEDRMTSSNLPDVAHAQRHIAARKPGRIQLIIILGALSAFGPLSTDMYLPSLPSLGHDFSTGAAQAQLTLSTCFLGLAIGQIIAGPLSDALGRYRPLLVGLAAFTLTSFLCTIAPSIYMLFLLRFVLGLGGAAGIVIARAIVRDLYEGTELARFFSLLLLVNGLAPILAPVSGGALLRFTSWRGIFVVLTIIGILLFLAAALGLKETLPSEGRQSRGIGSTLKTFRQLLTTRTFVGYALSCGLGYAAMFAYISGSSFVLQGIYGLSPQLFSVAFAVNALGIMLAGQINGRLVGRVSPKRLLAVGLSISATGGVLLLLVAFSRIGLVGVLPALFLVVASVGIIGPNATSLALAGLPSVAGSASALLGVLQFSLGALVSPLVGAFGVGTALPMAAVIAILGISALITFVVLGKEPYQNETSSLR